jgi:2-iminobutanoate/2-iminopropanoate deaminase
MVVKREIIGDQVIIGGRILSLSKAIRAGDFVFLTGQIPMKNGQPMTTGTVEEQTKVALEEIKQTLKLAGCGLEDIVKSMVWLRERSDFAGFNSVYGEYFPEDPPTRSAVISELLVDVRVEIEVVAFKSLK